MHTEQEVEPPGSTTGNKKRHRLPFVLYIFSLAVVEPGGSTSYSF